MVSTCTLGTIVEQHRLSVTFQVAKKQEMQSNGKYLFGELGVERQIPIEQLYSVEKLDVDGIVTLPST